MQALCSTIAKLYKALPDLDPQAKRAWHSLAYWSDDDAARLRTMFVVVEVDKDSPYETADDMFSDLDNGLFQVSRTNLVHPLWSPEQTVNFRICHDIMGHYAAHKAGKVADFSWEGELNAATEHEKALPAGACQSALATELLGQAAHYLTYGEFPANKVAFL